MKNIVKEIKCYLKLPYTIEIVPYNDGGYFARIKELKGCMTEGDTSEEVLGLLEDAKRVWSEAALEDGLEIPLPESIKNLQKGAGRIIRIRAFNFWSREEFLLWSNNISNLLNKNFAIPFCPKYV